MALDTSCTPISLPPRTPIVPRCLIVSVRVCGVVLCETSVGARTVPHSSVACPPPLRCCPFVPFSSHECMFANEPRSFAAACPWAPKLQDLRCCSHPPPPRGPHSPLSTTFSHRHPFAVACLFPLAAGGSPGAGAQVHCPA